MSTHEYVERFRVITMTSALLGIGPDSPLAETAWPDERLSEQRTIVETWEKEYLAETLCLWIGEDDYDLMRSWFQNKEEERFWINPDLALLRETENRKRYLPGMSFALAIKSLIADAETFWAGHYTQVYAVPETLQRRKTDNPSPSQTAGRGVLR